MADISNISAGYSLVVLCSSTMAVSSYLRNSLSEKVKRAKVSLEEFWEKTCNGAPNEYAVGQEVVEERDKVMAQPDLDINMQIGILATILVVTGPMQALEIVRAKWLTDWVSLENLVPGVFAGLYLVATAVIFVVFYKVWKFSSTYAQISDSVESVRKLLKTHLSGWQQNGK